MSVLLDPNLEHGDRDDAAMDLGQYDDPEAEEALARVACDENADVYVADSCGESLGQIWCRRNDTRRRSGSTLGPETRSA
jgi:hypothetical protein